MNKELKPCPFCGGKAELIGSDEPIDASGNPFWCVTCLVCGFRIHPNGDSDKVISNWNCREDYDEANLKACPFCGGRPEIISMYEPGPGGHYRENYIWCPYCGEQTNTLQDLETAIIQWNHRVKCNNTEVQP